MTNWKEKLEKLESMKLPLLILVVGAILMLLPSGASKAEEAVEEENPLQAILSCTQGVGEVKVIVSENGVVVACQGADEPEVCLRILKAVNAYTGFSSDRITILKMAEIEGGGKGT